MTQPLPRTSTAATAVAARVSKGTPAGGQFSTTSRPEVDVLLVEFSSDEAEQVDAALAATSAPDDAAHALVRAMRVIISPRVPFAAAEFDGEQVRAMHQALEFRRARAANPSSLAATEAAMFRLDTAVVPSDEMSR